MMKHNIEEQYLALLRELRELDSSRGDRTGVGTKSVFGRMLKHSDVSAEFPLITTKKVHFKSVFWELMWFLRGETNNKWLEERGVKIWKDWALEDGSLGPVYGKQWRDFNGEDQVSNLLHSLIHYPLSRRHIISAWNPTDVHPHDIKSGREAVEFGYAALPPCHVLYQFRVSTCGSYLDLCMFQRSADVFLGLPFNIASCATLMHLIGAEVGLIPRELTVMLGDAHLYLNHQDQANIQLSRIPSEMPTLNLKKRVDLFNYSLDDLEIIGYNPQAHIPAKIAV